MCASPAEPARRRGAGRHRKAAKSVTDVFQERASRAQGLLRKRGVDGLLLLPEVELFYLTGFRIDITERPSAAIIPFDGQPRFVVPGLEKELRGTRSWITRVDTWDDAPFEALARGLRDSGLERATIGVGERVPWGWIRRIEEQLPRIKFVSVTEAIESLRMVKDAHELELIRRACAITDRAAEAGFAALREGITELDLEAVIRSEMTRLGGLPQFCLVLFGERAALPHGMPSSRKLSTGDVVLVDTGCSLEGYMSDITRTVVFGQPSPRQRHVWETVLRAKNAAFEAIRPGMTCHQADAIARGIIQQAGLGEFFIHRLGLGLGLLCHEHPYLAKGNAQALEAGMTFTIEPGVYIPGELGVRLEDSVVLTAGGCRNLTQMKIAIEP